MKLLKNILFILIGMFLLSCQKTENRNEKISLVIKQESTFDGVFFSYNTLNQILVVVNAISKDSSSIRFVVNKKTVKNVIVPGEILMIKNEEQKAFGTFVSNDGVVNFFYLNYVKDYEMRVTAFRDNLIDKNSVYDVAIEHGKFYILRVTSLGEKSDISFIDFEGKIIKPTVSFTGFNILKVKQKKENTLQFIGETSGLIRLMEYDLANRKIDYDSIWEDQKIEVDDYIQFDWRNNHIYLTVANNSGSRVFSYYDNNLKVVKTTDFISDIGLYGNDLYISYLKKIWVNNDFEDIITNKKIHVYYETKNFNKWFCQYP